MRLPEEAMLHGQGRCQHIQQQHSCPQGHLDRFPENRGHGKGIQKNGCWGLKACDECCDSDFQAPRGSGNRSRGLQ